MDVMFYEVFKEEEESLRRYLAPSIQAGFTSKTIQAEGHSQPPAPLISVRTQSVIPVSWGKAMKAVLTRSTGFDHLLNYGNSVDRKLPYGYLPAYCARAVAEHAVMLVFSLMRGLKKQLLHFETFNRDGLTGRECLGKKLLVVGVGRIGSEIVKCGQGLGMDVRGHDLVPRKRLLSYVPLDEGIRFADMVVCALPLTRLTRGMMNYEKLRRARKGALLVNIGRGEITPVLDMKRLMEEGILGGLGLDIYEEESTLAEYLRGERKGELKDPNQAILELQGHDNVILTPHNAFNTREALERKAQQSAESVRQFLESGSFPWPVPVW